MTHGRDALRTTMPALIFTMPQPVYFPHVVSLAQGTSR
jgi:hypothetical protein